MHILMQVKCRCMQMVYMCTWTQFLLEVAKQKVCMTVYVLKYGDHCASNKIDAVPMQHCNYIDVLYFTLIKVPSSNGHVETSILNIMSQWNHDSIHVSNVIGPFWPQVCTCKQDIPTKFEGPCKLVIKPSATGENHALHKQWEGNH